ncbi:uncharacterized protein LOC121698382 [Alosa sapidissima]|uniref:uncharacterized protein LOC121698382 n=1 Tax=Alosa sapidissima TaxID=34773 RepID=UPI001C093D36|nr:uncharacterized protein LOC121698382 [Alosa sapidissima]
MLNTNFRFRVPKTLGTFPEFVVEERFGLISYDNAHIVLAILCCYILWRLIGSWGIFSEDGSEPLRKRRHYGSIGGMDAILTFYNRIIQRLEKYEVQLKQCSLQDSSSSDFSSSYYEPSFSGCSSRSTSQKSGSCRQSGSSIHSRSRRPSTRHLHRQQSKTSFYQANPHHVPEELRNSSVLLALEHLPCSQPTHSHERPFYFHTTMSSPEAASGKHEMTESSTVPSARCKADIVTRRATSTFPKVTLLRKSPRGRWKFAILVIQIVRMLLPARLKYAQKASGVKTTTEDLTTGSILPSAVSPPTMQPSPEMTKVSVNSQVFLQKLEFHLHRKLSEQLWGFPELVVKYVGEQIALQRLSSSTGDARVAQGHRELPGHWLKKIQNRYPMNLKELDGPKPKPIFHLVEHPDILKNPETPYKSQQDDHLGEKMDAKNECSLSMKHETKLGMKQLDISNRHRLANRLTFHRPSHRSHLMSISAIISTQTTQDDSVKKGPLKGRQAVTFINQFSLNRIEQNLTQKREAHLQGKQTPYSLSVAKMATASRPKITSAKLS